mmetsp:Transcript_49472/g.116136  ORF Transcript_49472/g.116136 Transcript_49472/m.116136 type:complete len:171 (+) Transcript_49472:883-1395(+)
MTTSVASLSALSTLIAWTLAASMCTICLSCGSDTIPAGNKQKQSMDFPCGTREASKSSTNQLRYGRHGRWARVTACGDNQREMFPSLPCQMVQVEQLEALTKILERQRRAVKELYNVRIANTSDGHYFWGRKTGEAATAKIAQLRFFELFREEEVQDFGRDFRIAQVRPR